MTSNLRLILVAFLSRCNGLEVATALAPPGIFPVVLYNTFVRSGACHVYFT